MISTTPLQNSYHKKNSELLYDSLESNLKIAQSRNPIMFFHKTSERERMNKEKGTRKISFQKDSQEANKNPHI